MHKFERHYINFKAKAIQLFGSLIMERSDDGVWVVSLGRLAFWAVFICAMCIWVDKRVEIPDTMFKMLMVLVSYNLGKKVLPVVTSIFNRFGSSPMPYDNSNTTNNTGPIITSPAIHTAGTDNGSKGINQE